MSPQYATPGVYIEEITGPGVIPGVGTNVAAFIGPALRGPMTPKTITTFDDFRRNYGRDGDFWPYLASSARRFYLAHAVQGFFENGGSHAVVVRVGTAQAAQWNVQNDANQDVFVLEALQEGQDANGYSIELATSATDSGDLVFADGTVSNVSSDRKTLTLTLNQGSVAFVVGDTVELYAKQGNNTTVQQSPNAVASVASANNVVTLTLADIAPDQTQQPTTGIRLCAISPSQRKFRVEATTGLQPGSLIRIDTSAANANQPAYYYAVVEQIDRAGFISLRSPLFQKQQQTGNPTALANPIGLRRGNTARRVQFIDFRITISDSNNVTIDDAAGLSLDPFHGGYVFRQAFTSVRVLQPSQPAATRLLSQSQPKSLTLTTPSEAGSDDVPDDVGLPEYTAALEALKDVDDVNLVCIPDGANDVSVQQAARDHCLEMRDRIAILDVPYGSAPADSNSALSHREQVQAESGFAALYYPWLRVPEPIMPGLPRPLSPQSLAVPPSGHIAGVIARTDDTRGVHYAPANTEVRGVMGLERVLSDREQALINLEGVNALRIFPGDGRVVVWGARTTAPKDETDWIFINVRRLLLYIEESIQEGIRWAVFKPNDRPLWQSLKRTLDEFLDRVWKDGGLAGAKREQAYRVRIDEGLNPPGEVDRGYLHIEISVAPVRPAEFIIVRIGLWDGGASVAET